MGAIANPNYLTLTDVAKMCHNQELVPMVDAISQSTTILNDMPWRESSDALRDVTGKVTDLPNAEWVGLDLGVKASKGSHTQIEEKLAIVESWSEINEKTYNVSPNKEQVRWENEQLHMKKMGMVAEQGILYGNPKSTIAEPNGILTRFAKVTDYNRKASGTSYDYCTLSCGGSTSNKQSSILVMARGAMCPTLLFPRYDANRGLVYRHFDWENSTDIAGGNVRIAKSQFIMTLGVSIADTRTATRVANIEVGNTTSEGKIRDALYEAVASIPEEYRSSLVMYAPKGVILALRKTYANYVNPVTYDNAGKSWNSHGDIYFDGMLIRECASMKDATEAVIS